MTTIQNIRIALLEAEPHELRGIGESPLARAVRSDPHVRAAADQILLATAALHESLAAVANTRAAHLAAGAGAPRERSTTSNAQHAGRQRRRPTAHDRRLTPRAWIGLGSLAAAALVALMLMDPASIPRPDTTTTTTTAAAGDAANASRDVPLTATLQAEADQPFGVFATDNPDIAIVWLFPREGE